MNLDPSPFPERGLPPRKAIPAHGGPVLADAALLHLGENPFPPVPAVLRAIGEAAESANRYPDTNANRLREALAVYVGHGAGKANLIVGNGSDELIDLAVTALTREGDRVLTFEPSFFVYSFCARRHGREPVSLPLDERYQLPPPPGAYPDAALTFIAHPNNPTGTMTPRERLVEHLERLPGAVVVDECYFEFSGETVADLLPRFPNLLVFRSLSKSFGLAGLRLGYAVGGEGIIERLERHALTFPVNRLAQAAGTAALEAADECLARLSGLIEARDAMRRELESMGLCVLPSRANFLLVFWPGDESPVHELAERGVLVSDQTAAMGRPAIRAATGTPDENRRLLQALRDMLSPRGGR